MTDLKEYVLLRASKKTLKVDMRLEATGKALMALWALQNTTQTKMCLIAEKDTGLVVEMYIGNKSGFPEVKKHLEDEQKYINL